MHVPSQEVSPKTSPGRSDELDALFGNQPFISLKDFQEDKNLQVPDDIFAGAPEEIRNVFDEYDLYQRKFTYNLKRIPEGGAIATGSFLEDGSNRIPTNNYIGIKYGPGRYYMMMSWHKPASADDPRPGGKTQGKGIDFTIDDVFADAHDEYMLKAQLESYNRRKKIVAKENLRKKFDFDVTGNTEGLTQAAPAQPDHVEQLDKMLKLYETQKKPEVDWVKALASLAVIATPIIQAIVNRKPDDTMQKMMMLMFANEKDKSAQFLELVKNQHGPSTGSDMMKQMLDVVMGGLDIRKALNEEKEDKDDVVTKVIGAIEKILPVVAIIAASKNNPQNIPMINAGKAFVQSDPAFQEVLGDPVKRAEAVTRLDEKYGCEQTDAVLSVMGLPRPAECQANYQRYSTRGTPPEGEDNVPVNPETETT